MKASPSSESGMSQRRCELAIKVSCLPCLIYQRFSQILEAILNEDEFTSLHRASLLFLFLALLVLPKGEQRKVVSVPRSFGCNRSCQQSWLQVTKLLGNQTLFIQDNSQLYATFKSRQTPYLGSKLRDKPWYSPRAWPSFGSTLAICDQRRWSIQSWR